MIRLKFLRRRFESLKPGRYSVRIVDVRQVRPETLEIVLDDVKKLRKEVK